MFTSKCFIRKNTPELINKLIDLGYVKALFDEEYTKSDAYGLIVDQGDIAPLEHPLQEDELMFTYNFIDCGENVGLFLTAQETRKKIANEVEQWILEHTYDTKYWDDYGENFCHSIFATDLKNFIREKSKNYVG